MLHSSVAPPLCLHGSIVPHLFTPNVRNKRTRMLTQAAPRRNDFILDTKQEVRMKTSGGQDQVSVQEEGDGRSERRLQACSLESTDSGRRRTEWRRSSTKKAGSCDRLGVEKATASRARGKGCCLNKVKKSETGRASRQQSSTVRSIFPQEIRIICDKHFELWFSKNIKSWNWYEY